MTPRERALPSRMMDEKRPGREQPGETVRVTGGTWLNARPAETGSKEGCK